MPILKKLDLDRLKNFALMFMEDCYQICNVSYYTAELDPKQTEFNLALRQFRHQHPWLAANITEGDRFDRITEGNRTIFYGVRYAPDSKEGVAMISHLEGSAMTINLADLLGLDLENWQIAIASPGLAIDNLQSFNLEQTQALLLKPVST